MTRISAVVVAWNRRDLLRECLSALAAQTRPLDAIVVVDNASDDDSAQVAREILPDVRLIRLTRNTGGAGGFAVGVAAAVADTAADLIWIMDDDTVPEPTALEELEAARGRLPDDTVVFASRVVWTEGTDHPMNTPRRHPLASAARHRRAEEAGTVLVRSASFVSLLVDARAVRDEGLPIADYFIWNDDFEYTTRLIRGRAGVYVPSSVVVHKTKALASTDQDPGARFYFEVRNKIWLFRHARGLTLLEKLVYGAATLRRWAATRRRTADPAELRDAERRGRRDGWGAPPRANTDSLADQPEARELLERFEAERTR